MRDGVGVIARDGSGVIMAIVDSGIDLEHGDFPEPLEAYDMTIGECLPPGTADCTAWGEDVSNIFFAHGTAVTGAALGRGTLSTLWEWRTGLGDAQPSIIIGKRRMEKNCIVLIF